MKIIHLSAIALLCLTTAAEAISITKKEVDKYAFETQLHVSELQACGDDLSIAEDLSAARQLDAKFFKLLDSAGLALANHDQHHKKTAIMRDLATLRDKSEKRISYCALIRADAIKLLDKMNNHIRKLQPSTPEKNGSSTASSCPRSADYYQDRYKLTTQVSDLACFQREATRELKAAKGQ